MLNQVLAHAWIASHIPHQGSMCLLDCVEAWDERRIQCRAISHRAADNPLRARGRLGAACGIEYAAQAMAVHGALLAPPDSSRARVGYLVSVRGTQLYVPQLDDIAADLRVEATCITRSGSCAPDGLNINFEVGATHPEALVAAVKAHKAHYGIVLWLTDKTLEWLFYDLILGWKR